MVTKACLIKNENIVIFKQNVFYFNIFLHLIFPLMAKLPFLQTLVSRDPLEVFLNIDLVLKK